MHDEEFRRAIEAIKLRAPVEDVVRERVPGLKKSGNGWVACCPFHEERTPSFRVDPRRGTWHCFGACGTGGDQIGFLQRIDNLSFLEALEILAARTGIELPRRARTGGQTGGSGARDAADALRRALDLGLEFYREQLGSPEGARARAYLRDRGLADATVESFGLGYAPSGGSALVSRLRAAGVELAHAISAGLVRQTGEGRAFDFFRARLVIPIRDERGRTVGFGARRLQDDDASGPKYVNTEETALFHKGQLVYALDRALPRIRREGRIVLVEGYTDVMAAHQHGFGNVVAVLGTSLTEDHAARVRRSGVRRATLVFDGDEAGSKAAARALHGLLPLDLEIDVVALPGGIDPCDLLVRDGATAFQAHLDLARAWFEHATASLSGFSGIALSREVDRVLDLLGRVRTPVHRESLLKALAARLEIPVESLREQARMRAGAPRTAARPTAEKGPQGGEAGDARVRGAWSEVVGALLADASLLPLARPVADRCTEPDLGRILFALFELLAEEDARIDEGSVMDRLAEDPARDLVVPLLARAQIAESPREQLEGALRRLGELADQARMAEVRGRMRTAEQAAGAAAATDPAAIEIARAFHEKRHPAAASHSD